MLETLGDPYKLALVLAVFSALVSMFACLYVWISDNRQYLQAENINESLRRMESRIQRMGVRDKFAQEVYHLLTLRDNVGYDDAAAHKARHYMLLFYDYLYRAFCDWQETLLNDREFGRMAAQFITFWYAESRMAGKGAEEWWLELSPGFHDSTYRMFVSELMQISCDYQKHPDRYSELLHNPEQLLATIFTLEPPITNEPDPIRQSFTTTAPQDAEAATTEGSLVSNAAPVPEPQQNGNSNGWTGYGDDKLFDLKFA